MNGNASLDSPSLAAGDSQPYMGDDAGSPGTGTRKHVLRLFMKHKELIGLERFLQDEQDAQGSAAPRMPKAKKALSFVKGFEQEQAAQSRGGALSKMKR